MKIVLQRVSQARVEVDGQMIGQIHRGMLVFLGIGKNDIEETADAMVKKLTELRIFEDENGKMNLDTEQVKAEFLVVSQFTLYGDCRKGRRPSFDAAAAPEQAEELYEYFVERLKQKGFKVETGQFAAMMDVSLVNDGPVTLVLEM